MNQLIPAPRVGTSATQFTSEAEVKNHFLELAKEQIKSKKVLFGVMAVAGLAIVAPVAVLAVKAGFALAALGGLVVCAVAAGKFIPTFFRKVENRVIESNRREAVRHLEALKAIARNNPIETLQNEYLAMEQQKSGIAEANTKFAAATGAYKSELAENKKLDPSVDYSDEQKTADEMQRVCDEQAQDLAEFVQALVAFKKKIDEAERKWNLAVKANAAFALLDEASKSSKMRDILVQVSFDEVRNQYSGLFARMNTRAIELSAARTLRIGHTPIDVSAINVPVIKEVDRVAVA